MPQAFQRPHWDRTCRVTPTYKEVANGYVYRMKGKQGLTRQIGRVEMLMELCPEIEAFKKAARKQKMISIAPYLFDDMNQIID